MSGSLLRPPRNSPGPLSLIEDIRFAERQLLDLPDGLHFTNIKMMCTAGDAGLAMDLVSRCSDTLESLCVDYSSSSVFPSAPEPALDLSRAAKLKNAESRFTGPSVEWVVATVQTAKTKTLQQVTIFLVPFFYTA
ncbi:hypothetical protein BJ322DRAFT_1023594 [Thelephora terrestris]|uniref:Uncharacterized protein n=1 Tax=Thelephora terrestris TaxID=56493 RepID=A0A9P6H7Q7_9AGAM|nr:hypothetical protein BJ322DRAFT_1023594 [Thelephora terrestris]